MKDAIKKALSNEETATRRSAIRMLGKLGMGTAAGLSTASFLGARPKEAIAEGFSSSAAHGVLNYALTLEYLEQFFYQVGTNQVVPSDAMPIFELIEKHEESHVDTLTSVVNSLDGPPDPVSFERSDFDFTAGGTFDPFNNYATFLTLSQGFEDTGVRAYKGQAPAIMGTPYLTAALQIHSLEARHAAQVRRLRESRDDADVEPWIVLDSGTDGTALEDIYGGDDMFPAEENATQAGVDLTTLGDYTAEEASAAFDEPLTEGTVRDIADPFTENDLDGDGDVDS